ncbi:MAG: hypothetical protein ACKV22_05145 [Bryobacteraceae bacterium]
MHSQFLIASDPVAFATDLLDFVPDPEQARFLASTHPRRVLNCTRQWGKSTVSAVLAVHRLAFGPPGNLTLIVATTLRQSSELIRKAVSFLRRLDFSPRGDGHNAQSLALPNRSRIVAVPGTEDTIRGFSAVDLLLLDEAARIPDALYYSVRPMLAASSGVILAMRRPPGAAASSIRPAPPPTASGRSSLPRPPPARTSPRPSLTRVVWRGLPPRHASGAGADTLDDNT